MRKLKQKPGENIQVFAERILSLAEEAFVRQGGDMVERQLTETFVDGLSNDQLKLKILRDSPHTLQENRENMILIVITIKYLTMISGHIYGGYNT